MLYIPCFKKILSQNFTLFSQNYVGKFMVYFCDSRVMREFLTGPKPEAPAAVRLAQTAAHTKGQVEDNRVRPICTPKGQWPLSETNCFPAPADFCLVKSADNH